MEIKLKNKPIEIKVKEVKGLGIVRGLMFRSRDKAPALLFNLKAPLHSFFVFFDFLVLWLDDEDEIVDFKIVSPWRVNINSKKNYFKIVEIPISRRYSGEVEFVVGKRFIKKND